MSHLLGISVQSILWIILLYLVFNSQSENFFEFPQILIMSLFLALFIFYFYTFLISSEVYKIISLKHEGKYKVVSSFQEIINIISKSPLIMQINQKAYSIVNNEKIVSLENSLYFQYELTKEYSSVKNIEKFDIIVMNISLNISFDKDSYDDQIELLKDLKNKISVKDKYFNVDHFFMLHEFNDTPTIFLLKDNFIFSKFLLILSYILLFGEIYQIFIENYILQMDYEVKRIVLSNKGKKPKLGYFIEKPKYEINLDDYLETNYKMNNENVINSNKSTDRIMEINENEINKATASISFGPLKEGFNNRESISEFRNSVINEFSTTKTNDTKPSNDFSYFQMPMFGSKVNNLTKITVKSSHYQENNKKSDSPRFSNIVIQDTCIVDDIGKEQQPLIPKENNNPKIKKPLEFTIQNSPNFDKGNLLDTVEEDNQKDDKIQKNRKPYLFN